MAVQAIDKTGRAINVGDVMAYAKSERGGSPEIVLAEVKAITEGKRTDQSFGPIVEVLTYEFVQPNGGERYLARSTRRIQFPERYIVLEREALHRYLEQLVGEQQ